MSDLLMPISASSKIANLNVGTARSWVAKQWLELAKKDEPASVAGATTLLSYRRVLQLAIAARLARRGMHPEAACNAARQFTDRYSPLEAPGHKRAPGELYEGAHTALCAYDDGSAAVVRFDRKTPFEQVFFPIGAASMVSARRDDAIVLFLDVIVKEVAEQFARFERGEAI